MTKSELQKELKEKVKEGVKPSDLKKLKRSKSADDVANIPLPPKEPDNKYPYTQLVSQTQEIDELKKETKAKSDTIKLLRDKIEKLESSPPRPLLAEQLKEKQKEIETLREQLETAHTTKSQLQQELNENDKDVERLEAENSKLLQQLEELQKDKAITPISEPSEENELSELDQSLISRHKLLGDWFKEYGKRKELETELAQYIDEAATEIIEQDELIARLRTENRQLKHTNQSLQRDLNSAERLAELRKNNVPYVRRSYSSDSSPDWLRILFYASLLVSSVVWLMKERKYQKYE